MYIYVHIYQFLSHPYIYHIHPPIYHIHPPPFHSCFDDNFFFISSFCLPVFFQRRLRARHFPFSSFDITRSGLGTFENTQFNTNVLFFDAQTIHNKKCVKSRIFKSNRNHHQSKKYLCEIAYFQIFVLNRVFSNENTRFNTNIFCSFFNEQTIRNTNTQLNYQIAYFCCVIFGSSKNTQFKVFLLRFSFSI